MFEVRLEDGGAVVEDSTSCHGREGRGARDDGAAQAALGNSPTPSTQLRKEV